MRFANKEKLTALIAKNDGLLIDMRTPIQVRDNPIAGAVSLYPLRNLNNALLLEKNKKRPVILFGSGPKDIEVAAAIGLSEGFGYDTYVTNLEIINGEEPKKQVSKK